MSNFFSKAKRKKGDKVEVVEMLDDYYGKHEYAVRFANGDTYREEDVILAENKPTKECFNGDGLHPKKSPKKDFIESKRKEFNKKIHIYKAAHKSETAKIDDWWNEEYGMSYYYEPHKEVEEFLTSSLNEAIDFGREEEYRESNKAMNAFKQQMEIKNISTRKLEDMICEIEEELDSRKI